MTWARLLQGRENLLLLEAQDPGEASGGEKILNLPRQGMGEKLKTPGSEKNDRSEDASLFYCLPHQNTGLNIN